jgi:hypothetical protein
VGVAGEKTADPLAMYVGDIMTVGFLSSLLSFLMVSVKLETTVD